MRFRNLVAPALTALVVLAGATAAALADGALELNGFFRMSQTPQTVTLCVDSGPQTAGMLCKIVTSSGTPVASFSLVAGQNVVVVPQTESPWYVATGDGFASVRGAQIENPGVN